MGLDTSIVFKGIDELTGTVTSIRNANKGLNKDLEESSRKLQDYRKRQEEIGKQMTETETALKKAKTAVKDAAKAYDELKDATSEEYLKDAIANQQKLTSVMREQQQAARDTEKSIHDLHEEQRKAENRGFGGNSLLSRISSAGLIKMAGDAASQWANTLMGSAYGSDAGSMFSSGLSGLASGAAMGSMVGAPLLGAVIGGLTGLASGAAQVFENQDAAYKSYVGEQYSGVRQQSAQERESGSSIAGGRESTRMAFNKLLGGPEEAGAYLQEVQRLAVDTNYTYDEITGYTKKLLNSFDSNAVLDVLMELSDATAGLSLNSSDVDAFVNGMSRLKTLGTRREFLNYFDERGLDTTAALSSYLGVDKSAIPDLIKRGKISGETSVEAIRAYMNSQYGGLSIDLAGTYNAMVDNLGDTMDGINAALGDAYNTKRKEGLEDDLEEYGGSLGTALMEANRIIGESHAYAENLSAQYRREALSAVLENGRTTLYDDEQVAQLEEMNERYADLLEAAKDGDSAAGLEIEALKGEAVSLAEEAYGVSDVGKAIHDVELDLIAAIQDNTSALGTWQQKYEIDQATSKGSGKGLMETFGRMVNETFENDYGVTVPGLGWMSKGAWGLNRVPYDDYPALLHQGERVLTASEARAQDAGGESSGLVIQVTGNSFVGTGEEMADQVAQILVKKVSRARMLFAPE